MVSSRRDCIVAAPIGKHGDCRRKISGIVQPPLYDLFLRRLRYMVTSLIFCLLPYGLFGMIDEARSSF